MSKNIIIEIMVVILLSSILTLVLFSCLIMDTYREVVEDVEEINNEISCYEEILDGLEGLEIEVKEHYNYLEQYKGE